MSKFWRKEILDKREDNMEKDGETPLKTSNKPHSKPFVIERRYVDPIEPIRHHINYSRDWKKFRSFAKLNGAKQSLKSWVEKDGGWSNWEFRIVNLNENN